MRPLARLDRIAVRTESCRFAQFILGDEGSKSDYLDWIEFFERVQLEGASAVRGVYGAAPEKVVPLRVVGCPA